MMVWLNRMLLMVMALVMPLKPQLMHMMMAVRLGMYVRRW